MSGAVPFHFDPDKQYQHDALAATLGIFRGQGLARNEFELAASGQGTLLSEHGVGNDLELDDDALARNLRDVQEASGLPEAFRLGAGEALQSNDFSVEMETGTGKTYVYLRSIFELHRTYGFSKFVIVVPTVATREGTLSHLRVMEGHLRDLYDGVQYTAQLYNARRLAELRGFAQASHLAILVMNIDAFNKTDVNLIHREQDRMMGHRPIDFVRATNPIVVLDEPQNMEGDNAKNAIASLNPLVKLRYSATHRNRYNLIYRLTPAQAFEQGLVKELDVWSVLQDQDMNRPYIRLDAVKATSKSVSASVTIDVAGADGVARKKIALRAGDDLHELSGGRSLYQGYAVEEIGASPMRCEFGNGVTIGVGEEISVNREAVQKAQIRAAVQEHLDKELALSASVAAGDIEAPMKVLSLFFVDRVANYHPVGSKFRVWFEEAYCEFAAKPKYGRLGLPPVEQVHGGYFSEAHGVPKDTSGSTKDDSRTYELIMRRKDDLLDVNEPLRFIFSHSALREGWDNPNVFVIATLNDTKSEVKKRQEIGRGLRLPVMANGDQCFVPAVNRLCVVANEAYDDFAATLQKEIEGDTGTPFPRKHIKDRSKRKLVRLRKGVLDDDAFKGLWDAIKHRTRYHVGYDADAVVKRAVAQLKEQSLTAGYVRVRKAALSVTSDKGVVPTGVVEKAPVTISGSYPVPDLLGHLARALPVSRATIARVIVESGRLGEVSGNPQEFIDQVRQAVMSALLEELAEGITYEKVGGTGNDAVYEMRLLEEREITSYLENLVPADRSAYEEVLFDSDVEHDFALALDKREDIKVFIKLPWWFKIDTPIGPYNPDWAIVKTDEDEVDRAYLVRETKGTKDLLSLRGSERLKINFGKRHFKALDVDYRWVKDAAEV